MHRSRKNRWLPFAVASLLAAGAGVAYYGFRGGRGPGAAPHEVVTNSVGMRLVRIEPGRFQMGSPARESGHDPDEFRHEVEITRPFFLGECEVTREQYQAVMGASAGPADEVSKGANLPVENVTWDEAREFCERLSKREGRRYRLPTEAEWEYACRAGTDTPFSCGGVNDIDDYCWHKGNSYVKDPTDPTRGVLMVHAVGTKKPNAWGLYDMHGGAWEWCADWYAADYYRHSPTRDPPGPARGEFRVARGGSRADLDGKLSCRSAKRLGLAPDIRLGNGFRVVLEVAAK